MKLVLTNQEIAAAIRKYLCEKHAILESNLGPMEVIMRPEKLNGPMVLHQIVVDVVGDLAPTKALMEKKRTANPRWGACFESGEC